MTLKKGETIEKLKKEGCFNCGGHVFEQKRNEHRILPDVKKSLGTHILVDFYGCCQTELNDIDKIRKAMLEAARLAKASVVEESFHMFSPYGVSGAVIIQESHFTIHTWPEYCYAAIDLFTCGDNLDLKRAMLFLKDRFACSRMEYTNVLRGRIQDGIVVQSGRNREIICAGSE